jgi:hypothetical protein
MRDIVITVLDVLRCVIIVIGIVVAMMSVISAWLAI